MARMQFYFLISASDSWNNARADNIGAGFRWEVVNKTLRMDYLVNWVAVAIFGMIVSALFGRIPLLGTGITMYVTGVFSYTVFAEIYESL